MNRADRGPLLLIIAGILLLLAIVAYSIDHAEESSLRKEAALRGRQTDREPGQRSILESKALQGERARTIRDVADLHGQHDEILKSLKQIEKLLEAASRARLSH